jgi:Cu+-exporting ATPase
MPAFGLNGKAFCCLGCETVFSLLNENGLGQYYTLETAPGTRVRAAVTGKWAFLDDPAVGERLFDFTEGAQTRVTLHLPVIHCIACVWLLENLFKLHPGVGRSQVNFSRREASIAFDRSRIKFSELAALLTGLGYEPQFTLGETAAAVPAAWRKKAWLQMGLAAFGFGNIMLMSLPFYLGLDTVNGPWFKLMAGWLSLALALPVVTYSAAEFWRAAWAGLRQRTLTLEVPIALGLAAIYGSSLYEVFSQRGPGYCDSLCGLIFFLLCGRMFQKMTHDRLTFDRDYQGFFPLSVMRSTAGGEESVAISQIQTGDHLILRNGELLPADARLVSGNACMDYSFVTGESDPVKRQTGDHLYAGGRQVGGAITVETVKPVAQSYLATLWNHEAFRKPRNHDLDSLTSRYSRRFTKLVVGVALTAAIFWFFRDAAKAEKVFISVLIVACPCALALAAPFTQGTAQRLLAHLNIFLKNGMVIERLAGVDTVVLDKTGTLTTGDVRGVKFQSGGRAGLTPEEAQWIGSLARHSTHPHSVRIAHSLTAEPLPVQGFHETPGCGIAGEIAGHRILLGSPAWLQQQGVTPDANAGEEFGPHRGWPRPRIEQFVRSEASEGGRLAGAREEPASQFASGVQVAIDGQWRGRFALENSLRPEAAQLIAQLGGRFELALLSGDNEREAERFQQLFGRRATLRFNQSPADKLNFIRELQQRGRTVMMVGDGLNDAGALKQADVGVAVVERIGVFSPASDVILDAEQLPQLARVLAFARSAARVVRTGFLISALYNLAGVSIAAAGLLTPIVCAILMPVSSTSVVLFACGATAWLGARTLRAPEGRQPTGAERALMAPVATSWEAA